MHFIYLCLFLFGEINGKLSFSSSLHLENIIMGIIRLYSSDLQINESEYIYTKYSRYMLPDLTRGASV